MRTHFRLPIAVLLAVCMGAGLSACKGKPDKAEAAKADAASAPAVSVAPVRYHVMEREISATGPVTAREEMQLGVELSGLRVTALHVDVGQQVQRGQVLLSLDHRTLDSDLAQANAAMREAEAGAALARANLARGQNLAKDKFISAMQLDELRANRTAAEARLGTARAARDASALRRSFADLRAPASGIISKRLVQPGQVVGAGQELLRLIRDGQLEWRAELPIELLGDAHPGSWVNLKLPGNDTSPSGFATGRIRAVSPGVDAASRTGTVYADLMNYGGMNRDGLKAGAYLKGVIRLGNARVLGVPQAAIVQRDGYSTVFIVDADNIAHQVRVETGQAHHAPRDANLRVVEIVRGVNENQRVVIEGAGFLADGDKVRVVPVSADKRMVAMTEAEEMAGVVSAVQAANSAAAAADAAARATDKEKSAAESAGNAATNAPDAAAMAADAAARADKRKQP